MFWKPGTSGPGGSEREDDSAQPIDPKLSNLPLEIQRKSLPIYRHRNSVLFALQKHRTVVIVGETGCGKTTQVSSRMLRASRYAGVATPDHDVFCLVAQNRSEQKTFEELLVLCTTKFITSYKLP